MSVSPRVLVTGGSGFVGLAAVKALLAAGRRVTATTTRPGTPPLTAEGLDWVGWDAETTTLPPMEWDGIDAVCHLAVPRQLSPFPDRAAALYAVNVQATFALLEASRRHGVRRFLLASTGDVLAPESELAPDGDTGYAPRNFYGSSKICAEVLTQAYGDILSPAILRIYHPYGPNGERFLINRLLRKVEAGEEIRLEGTDGILVNPIWIDDLGQAIARLAEGEQTGLFNLGGREFLRLGALLRLAGELCGRTPLLHSSGAPPDPRHAGEVEASCRRLNWAPRIDLREGLSRLLIPADG
ncbi:UDP-glucose 4-epimerase [Paramagnetospirillum magnetotacticum MS-1]|uniref:UDP-glucose 4-epimerase n=1 Tax=Paramagnetospirillum magnetotacticum MS-1 TaxID=272627 RepID=A0A0C2UY96_PARME|nr:NAD(P)-dependent oxidoreductase [Paramagnetospirillum magnetotacticum]KIL97776.1 UDP-glucose 4-epimerase [Paramagnetospirillum magnetotacticum MS-1]